MSTVLTKPVLLDETGQAIVDKLEDIQQAIGGTGEFIPINIRVTTPPTKTNYLAGETLDLSGMVVTLVANNGGMYDVTGDCVFSPADGSTVTSSTTEVNISYTWYKDSTVFTAVQPIGIKELASIAVTTPPTVTEYDEGDTLDLTGMVVTATFSDGTTGVVTNDCTFSPADGDTLAVSDTTISISLTMGTVTKTATQAITVNALIYGVEWDGTATTSWTRTDAASSFTDPIPAVNNGSGSSPFDNILPWSGMQIVEDNNAGTVVVIPKFYYKWTRSGSTMKLQVSQSYFEGSHISPAHCDRGDGVGEREYVYVGRYQSDAATFKSISNVAPVGKSLYFTRAEQRTAIHNNGTDIWQSDYAMFWTIRMLYLVEFANWDSQSTIGAGGGSTTDYQVDNTGGTDAMQYHTGTTAQTRTAKGRIQYRHIEDLWSNYSEWCDGIRFAVPSGGSRTNRLVIIKNPADFSDDSNGVEVADRITGNGGYISGWSNPSVSGYDWALYPSAISGSDSTYICDRVNTDNSGITLKIGTNSVPSSYLTGYGAFACFDEGKTDKSAGSRLMKLP